MTKEYLGHFWRSLRFFPSFLPSGLMLGSEASPWLWLQPNKVLHKYLCPSIPPTQSLWLHTPKWPRTPAETDAGLPSICAHWEVSASHCHAFPGMSSQPTSRQYLKPLLPEGFADLLPEIDDSFCVLTVICILSTSFILLIWISLSPIR